MYEAARLCPEAVFIKPQHHLYIQFSTRILRIMRSFTPLVEPFSIDEAFLDVTGCQKLFGSPVEMAQKLKKRIREEAGVTCSIGIGPNKLLAKMAAEMQKPDGLTVLNYEDVPSRIWLLPVRELFGVGPRYEHHLKLFNIQTIGDLARFPVQIWVVALSLKDANFAWLSRMKTLPERTDLAADIYRAAVELLKRHWPEGWPVRMVGVALASLLPAKMEQLTLFGEREKIRRSERACDGIRSRFGERAVFRAVSLTKAGVRYA